MQCVHIIITDSSENYIHCYMVTFYSSVVTIYVCTVLMLLIVHTVMSVNMSYILS